MLAARFLAAMIVLVTSIGLAVDLVMMHGARRPTPGRHVVLALALVTLLTWRICDRLATGTM